MEECDAQLSASVSHFTMQAECFMCVVGRTVGSVGSVGDQQLTIYIKLRRMIQIYTGHFTIEELSRKLAAHYARDRIVRDNGTYLMPDMTYDLFHDHLTRHVLCESIPVVRQ